MQPLVSILIPCYNAGPWVADCIQSALNQTYPHKEVVVVDDGSADDSLTIVRGFQDRIRFETGPNRGGNVARNRLLALSRGEWLEFLDADDFLLPAKIEKQMALVSRQPDLDVVYSPTRELFPESGAEHVDAIVDEDVYANYFRWTYFSTTSLLVRRAAVVEVGGWKEEQAVCQEHELVLRLLLAGKNFGLMPEALGVNRMQNPHSVSNKSPVKTLSNQAILLDRLEEHLLANGKMTEPRRVALAQARLLAARAAFSRDKGLARAFASKALATGPFVRPPAVNALYAQILRAFGFDCAEFCAKAHRLLRWKKHGAL